MPMKIPIRRRKCWKSKHVNKPYVSSFEGAGASRFFQSTTAEHLQAECLQLAEKKQTKKKKRDSQARTATVVVTVFLCFSTDGIPRKRQQGRKACGQYESKEVTVLVLKVLQF
jgi:hypothetical protein